MLPPWLMPTGIALIWLSLAVRPSWWRPLIFIPTCLLYLYGIFYTTTGSATSDFGLASAMATYILMASDFMLVSNPQKDLRLVGQKEPIYLASWSARMAWALNLSASPRGLGWAHEPVRAIRPRPRPQPRFLFVFKQLFWSLYYILLFDVLTIYVRSNPTLAKGGPSIYTSNWWDRLLFPLAFGATAYPQVALYYTVLSAVVLSTGFTRPEDWPPLFGAFTDLCSIRELWGRVWHQMLRRPLMAHSDFVVHKLLRLARGITASVLKLIVAFLLSACIHHAGDYAMLRRFDPGALIFYSAQAPAIAVEMGVLALARGLRVPSTFITLFGYLWTWVWFAYCLPIYLEPVVREGLLSDGLNYSIILGLWKGEWVPEWKASPSMTGR
ncbi:hypothetical protein FISHEDRAFT_65482 [Fistulina hepatica ATCC 64428]|nr:hypothetical protein FISHEDRAFT_65482 [Fistulina hepatica ATCC 64428]